MRPRLLIWLSGAQPELLKQAPADRAKYVGMGSVVLITATIAALSMTFALHTALKVALAPAIFLAVLWGLAIMSIDRWLVVSLQRQGNPVVNVLLFLVRLSLGLLFGFVISTPFVLQIFNADINRQVSLNQRAAASAYFARLKHDPLTQKIATDQTAVNNLTTTINTGGGLPADPYQNSAVQALIQQRQQALNRAAADYNQWQCQLYGLPKNACNAGNGPLAQASHQRYLDDELEVTRDTTLINDEVAKVRSLSDSARSKKLAEAQASLPAAQAQLSRDEAGQKGLTANFQNQNASTAGLLLRLQALDDAASKNSALSFARWLLLTLFTMIECLPILVKTLLNFLPVSLYEKLVARDEKRRLRVAEERMLREQAAEIIGNDSIIDEAYRLAEDRQKIYPKIRQATIDAEERVALRIVRDWEARESRNLADGRPWSAASRAQDGRDPAGLRAGRGRGWRRPAADGAHDRGRRVTVPGAPGSRPGRTRARPRVRPGRRQPIFSRGRPGTESPAGPGARRIYLQEFVPPRSGSAVPADQLADQNPPPEGTPGP